MAVDLLNESNLVEREMPDIVSLDWDLRIGLTGAEDAKAYTPLETTRQDNSILKRILSAFSVTPMVGSSAIAFQLSMSVTFRRIAASRIANWGIPAVAAAVLVA